MKNISVMPVKKYNAPKYPTQTETARTPELLRKLPSNWEKNVTIVAAVGMLSAMTLTSCGIFDPKNNTGTGYNPDSENYLNVAPIFYHGEGTGAVGCMMIAPPVFLSEQEAFVIIKSVAETGGLNFSAKPPNYTAKNNAAGSKEGYGDGGAEIVLGSGKVGLELYDKEKGIAVTYISMDEAEEKYLPNKDGTQMMSSVTFYRSRDLAGLTAEDFAQQKGDIAVGVFYDPGKDWESEEHQRILDEYHNSEKSWDAKRTQYESDVKLLIEEQLRAQVRDFIEWLQGQGII